MSFNTFGHLFRVTTWGESHGPAIGATVDGCPPGVPLAEADLQPWLDARKPGQNKYTTQRREDDLVRILSGTYQGVTTGTPIQLMIDNTDQRSKDYGDNAQSFRPGHADITYHQKDGVRDPRGGGRSSARETASRVAAGGIARAVLARLAPGLTPSALLEASSFLGTRLKGRTLTETRSEMRAELDRARRELNETAARLVEDGLAAWSGGEDADRSLIVRGRANLLGDAGAVADLEQVRRLFNDLEQKEQLIGLLDDVRDAQGVRIFIGAETRLFSLSGSAVIAAPYMSGRQKVLGAIGVIGPARLNYARVIPLVDYTARVLGRMLDG
jgi:hypothetical protein